MMQIGNRQVTKIIAGGQIIWKKSNWHQLQLLDDQVTGDVRFMIIDDMILFDGQITFNKIGVFIHLFDFPEQVTNPTLIGGDVIYLAETKNDNGSLPTSKFELKMDGVQLSGALNSAQAGMRTLDFSHFRMKLIKS